MIGTSQFAKGDLAERARFGTETSSRQSGVPEVRTSKTQGDQAYQSLRADILACRLTPGVKLKISDLAVALNLSLGSIREALSRLAAEGWLIAEPQKGYRVAPISRNDLISLTKARIEIETLCLKDAADNGGIEWESRILSTFHTLRHLPERNLDDRDRLDDDWSTAHSDFHDAILATCSNPWLLRMRRMLFAQSERYRRLSVPLRHIDRDVNQEHHDLMKAILARDITLATSLLARHFETTTDIVLESLEQATFPS